MVNTINETAPHKPTTGKHSWIESAHEQFERPLLNFAQSIVKDFERARDVVQETFMRMQKQDMAVLDGHLSRWLFTVCRNCAIKLLSKESRYVYVEQDAFERHQVESISPLQEMVRQETVERLMRHVKMLPANKREVVRLRFKDNLSYLEISAITGLSRGNVGFLLSNAMQHLRKQMEGDEKEERLTCIAKRVA